MRAMNFRSVFHVIAWLLLVVGALMGVCAGYARVAGEASCARALGWPALGTALASALLWAATRGGRELSRRDGLGVVTLGWLLAGGAAALPFWLSGAAATPMSAFFEAMSGITTTGATVLGPLEALPRGLLLWRAALQFLGGMGVLVLVLALLPMAGAGGMQLYRAEMPGPSKDRLEPRMAGTAKGLWGVYVLLTALLLLVLRLLGMGGFDALCHALTTVATGGFSTRTAGIAAFDSAAIEAALVVFMLLGGINFSLHYRALRGEFAPLWRHGEVRFFLGAFVAAVAAVVVLAHPARAAAGGTLAGSLREVVFTAASFATTTGHITADPTHWPPAAQLLLALLMLMGGCAASTSGGLKAGRVQVLLKACWREVRLFVQPRAVIPVRLNGRPLDAPLVLSMAAFAALFVLLVLAGAFALSAWAPDLRTAAGASLACVTNTGPGFAGVGPAETYARFPDAAKGVLCLLMLAGRLELYTVLALFMPAFWRA